MSQLNIPLTCPKCKREIVQSLQSLKPGNSVRCPRCRTVIRFKGDDLSKLQKSIDDFAKKLSK